MINVRKSSITERAVRHGQVAEALRARAAQPGGACSILERIDESIIDPGVRFDHHSHSDVEILTYVVEGCLDYRDEDGRRELVLGGEAQCVQAGTDLTHTEANASHSEVLHVIEATLRLEGPLEHSGYQSRYFTDDAKLDKLCPIAAPGGGEGVLGLCGDATVYAGVIRPGEPLLYYRRDGRRAWVQLARGQLLLNDELLDAGDAAAIEGDGDTTLRLLAQAESELLLFDLP